MSFPKTIYLFVFLLSSLVLLSQNGDKANEKDTHFIIELEEMVPDVVPVFTAEESLKKFKVAPGFRVEWWHLSLWLRIQYLSDWDDEGRMWVGEPRTYMRDLDGTGENERMSRVMVLEDKDRDGDYGQVDSFVDDMINVRCIAFVDDGALVVEFELCGYAKIMTEIYDVTSGKS